MFSRSFVKNQKEKKRIFQDRTSHTKSKRDIKKENEAIKFQTSLPMAEKCIHIYIEIRIRETPETDTIRIERVRRRD